MDMMTLPLRWCGFGELHIGMRVSYAFCSFCSRPFELLGSALVDRADGNSIFSRKCSSCMFMRFFFHIFFTTTVK